MSDLMRARTRCKARRKNGQPCKNPPITGGTVCRMHGGAAGQVKRKARQRILEAADDAASFLVRVMSDNSIDIRVRVQIAQDFLNRAGITSKTAVEVEVRKVEQLLAPGGGILVDLDATPDNDGDNVVDAEIVDEPDNDDELRRDAAKSWLRDHDMVAVPGPTTRGRSNVRFVR